MARVRPLSDLPKVIGDLREAAAGMPPSVVPKLADGVRDETAKQGGRYHVKGRGGRPVRLTAKVERGRDQNSRSVAGNPPGFWRIIEEGSNAHLITGESTRTTRSGRTTRIGQRSRLRQFEAGDAIRGKPLRIPGIGFRQYAVHPGHGSVGRPWKQAMSNSDRVVSDVLKREATGDFMKAWGG